MDIFDSILKSDIIDLLDEVRGELSTTKAIVLIQVTDNDELHVRSVNLNIFETVGICQAAAVHTIDEGEE